MFIDCEPSDKAVATVADVLRRQGYQVEDQLGKYEVAGRLAKALWLLLAFFSASSLVV